MNPDYAALSASDGDGEPVRATVQSPGRSIGSTTIPVQATTNWPAGTFIATTGTLLSSGKLDPTTVQVFYGTASGTDITITAYAAGYTDKGNEAGDVVVIKPTTEWANIVAEGIVGTTQFPANFANFVEASGGVWSAGAGLVGSGTAGFVWYNGARSAMAAVTNHTFAASKDTYIDYNPTSATFTYLPETNGSVEPAVSTGSVRIAKVVTGSSAITSIYQAKYQAPNPLVWQYLGSATSSVDTTATSTPTQVSGLSIPVVVPAIATKVRITVIIPGGFNASADAIAVSVWRGTVGSGTQVGGKAIYNGGSGGALPTFVLDTPVTGAQTYNIAIDNNGGGGTVHSNGSGGENFAVVEVC